VLNVCVVHFGVEKSCRCSISEERNQKKKQKKRNEMFDFLGFKK